MDEDGLHCERILDGGDEAEAAATPGAGQDIEIEHAGHQWPDPGSPATAGRDSSGTDLRDPCVAVDHQQTLFPPGRLLDCERRVYLRFAAVPRPLPRDLSLKP
jgi:hypothetical protein